MDKSLFQQRQKSYIEKGEIYFWTATINQWQRLLENDEYKDVIVDSVEYLTDSGKIDVFAFIIMPKHIHLIWRVNEPTGKKSAQGSLLKYTAHQFKKKLQQEDRAKLESYKLNSSPKNYEFCPKDSFGGNEILWQYLFSPAK